MTDQQLLSDLCSICHVNTPKYKCPRCSTRTCSLICAKRHKKRADCSGQRDPAAFVKKADLYTAAGVDRDFNFISGIERGANDAENIFNDAIADPWHDNPKRQYALANALRRSGVRLERAPRGLTRQLQNRTRWAHNSRSIMWTLEWIEEDKSRHVDDVSESTRLCDAHVWHMRRVRGEQSIGQRRKKRRKLGHNRHRVDGVVAHEQREDRHDELPADVASDADNMESGNEVEAKDGIELPAPPDFGRKTKLENNDQPSPRADDGAAVPMFKDLDSDSGITLQATAIQDEAGPEPAGKVGDTPNSPETHFEIENQTNATRDENEPCGSQNNLPVGAPDKEGYYYYLVKTRTTARETVLIPLSPTAPLSLSLRGQRLLEFPSIQILRQSGAALPAGFVLERDYAPWAKRQEADLKRLAAEHELEARTAVVGAERGGDGEQAARPRAVPNSSDIAAILQRDVLGLR